MGIAKKTDGRYVVGLGVSDANDYKGSASYRDIYIQLTADGATEESVEYLTYLKDYAIYHNGLGEPIMPPSVNVWISNNGVTTAVEADDLKIEDGDFTICGITYSDGTWDYSNAGTGGGGGGSSLPSYTTSDIGKVLTVVEDAEHPVEGIIIPEQTVTYSDDSVLIPNAGTFGDLSYGDAFTLIVNGNSYEAEKGTPVEFDENKFYVLTVGKGGVLLFDAFDTAVPGHIGDETPIPGTYTISATASVPSVSPSWVSGGACLVVTATGECTYTPESGGDPAYWLVGIDKTGAEVMACFKPATAKPVFLLVPQFSNSSPYYTYENDGVMIHITSPFESNSGLFGQAESAYFTIENDVFCLYAEGSSQG